MALTHSPKITTDGLALYLDAANSRSYPRSGTVWNDLSGSSIVGTLTNNPSYSSSNTGSIVFDGVDDYIAIPTYSNTNLQNGSIETWIYFTNNTELSSQNVQIYLIPTQQPSGEFFRLFFYRNSHWSPNVLSNFLYFKKASDATTGASIPQNVTYNVNQWYQNVFTWSINGIQKIYQNGELKSSITQTDFDSWYAPTGAGFNLGRFSAGFQGSISKFQIYNKTLSLQEVQRNFNALRGRFGI